MNRRISTQFGLSTWLTIALLAGLMSTGLFCLGMVAGKADAASRTADTQSCALRASLKRQELRLARAERQLPKSQWRKLHKLRRRLMELRRKSRGSSACPAAALPSPPSPPSAVEPFPVQPAMPMSEGEQTSSRSKAAQGPLSIAVKGNRLVDGTNQTVLLHGVDLSGTMWKCLGGKGTFVSPTDLASLKRMVAWHINAVRIPMNEDCWLGINGAPTEVETYHHELQEVVERLHSLGMYAILDLHWSAPGSTLSHLGPGFAGWFEMADADHAPPFWESVASYFKKDPAVLFDLYNEPFEISWSCWLSGCWAPRGYETAGMQELVEAVRRTGATQPVLAAGLQWASLAGSGWLEHMPFDPAGQLAASIHAYGVLGNFDKNVGVVKERVPVVMTEIGETDCAFTSLEKLLPWADAHGVSYLAWAWYTGDCAGGPALISNYEGTPTPYGIGFREHLVANFSPPPPRSG